MVRLTLTRFYFTDEYTLGHMESSCGRFRCFTCEDTVREAGVKVQDKTAIPTGEYDVQLTMSNRFKKVMPQLMNVPMFEGIRIHQGNSAEDTSGCVLVGHTLNASDTLPLANSGVAFGKLMNLLDDAADKNEPVKILIKGMRP